MYLVKFKVYAKSNFQIYKKNMTLLEATDIKQLIEVQGHWVEKGLIKGPPVTVLIELQT